MAFAAVLAIGGCAGARPLAPAASDYDALVARAEREIKRADDQGFLWLNTESYLVQSREARKSGDIGTAFLLAQQALEEALLAQKQAAESAAAKPDFTYRR